MPPPFGTSAIVRVREVFDRVVVLPEHERTAAIDQCCGEDAALRDQVLRLLEIDQTTLENPAEPASAAAAWPEAGERLGPYLIEQVVAGQRDHGFVLKAADENGRSVAIKAFARRHGRPAPRLLDEAGMLRRAAGLGVPELLAVGSTDWPGGHLDYIAMSWVEGTRLDLWSVDPRSMGDFDRVARVFASLCEIVGRLHEVRLCHGDLKPANVIVDSRDRVTLLDLRCASRRPRGWFSWWGGAHGSGAAGMAGGTPSYMSPQQAGGSLSPSARDDVFAIGLMLLEALSGRPARDGIEQLGLEEQLELVRLAPTPRLAALCPAAGIDLDRIVLKATRTERFLRFASAARMEQQQRDHLAGRQVPEPRTPWIFEVAAFARRHRVVTASAVVALLLILSMAVFSTSQAVRAQRLQHESERRLESMVELATAAALDADDKLRGLPGTAATRRMLAEQAAEHLERSVGPGHEPRAIRRVAEARIRLARAMGAGWGPHLGDLPGARQELVRASDALRTLVESSDAEAADRWRLGEALMLRASHEENLLDWPGFAEAGRLLFYDADALDAQGRRAAADWLLYSAMSVRTRPDRGGVERALDQLGQAVGLLEHSAEAKDAEIVARLLRHRAMVKRQAALSGGEADAGRAYAIIVHLAASETPPGWLHHQRAIHEMELAQHLALLGDWSAAEHARRAVATIDAVSAMDPSDGPARRTAAVLPAHKATVLHAIGSKAGPPIDVRVAVLEEAVAAVQTAMDRVGALAARAALQRWEQHYPATLAAQREGVLESLRAATAVGGPTTEAGDRAPGGVPR